MWILCLFLFNTFVFETTFVFFSETKVAFFFCLVFSLRRAIRRLAPQGGKALHSALRAPLEHESLRAAAREVLLRFLMARHAKRDTAVPSNACSAAASRHKEACPSRGQSSSLRAAALRSSTNPCALSCARSSRTFMARQKAPAFDGGFWRAIRNSNP